MNLEPILAIRLFRRARGAIEGVRRTKTISRVPPSMSKDHGAMLEYRRPAEAQLQPFLAELGTQVTSWTKTFTHEFAAERPMCRGGKIQQFDSRVGL